MQLPQSLPKRRRWRQFSLAALLIAVTIAAVWIGWLAHRVRQQREALALIDQLSGTVYFEHEQEAWKQKKKPELPGLAWLREGWERTISVLPRT